jgi:hypothetical protein
MVRSGTTGLLRVRVAECPPGPGGNGRTEGRGGGESGTNVLSPSAVVMDVRVLWSAGLGWLMVVVPSVVFLVPICKN